MKVYNGIWSGGQYLPSGTEAYIKLIPNPDKDASQPSSYRPISLLNIDAKILSKIVAIRLARIMLDLIHPAQAGFIQGRSAMANIRKVLAVLEYAKNQLGAAVAIVTLDNYRQYKPTVAVPSFISFWFSGAYS